MANGDRRVHGLESPGLTLADQRRALTALAADNNMLNEVVCELAERSGEPWIKVFGEVTALIDAARERGSIDESEHDPERLALADRLQARAIEEHITFSEALEKEGY
jgi:hypothetical protein